MGSSTVFTRHFLSSLARAHKQKGLVTRLAYSNQTVLLGCNGATISDVTLKILTGRQILSSTHSTENSCL